MAIARRLAKRGVFRLVCAKSRRSQNGNLHRARRREACLRTVDPEAACIFTGSKKCQPAMTLRWLSYFEICAPRAECRRQISRPSLRRTRKWCRRSSRARCTRLPPWPETYRVIATYGDLAQSRRAAVAPPHLCPGRGGRRRARAKIDAGRTLHDAARERRARVPGSVAPGGTCRALPHAAGPTGSAAAKAAAVSAGPASAAAASAISTVSADAATGPAASPAATTTAATSAATMAAAAKRGATRPITHAASAAAAAAPEPSRATARGEGTGGAATASSQACSPATGVAFAARGEAAEEGLAMEGACKMGRGDPGHFGRSRRAVDVARQAQSAWSRSRPARRQIHGQGRAGGPQRPKKPKGRSPSRPLIASLDLLDFRT